MVGPRVWRAWIVSRSRAQTEPDGGTLIARIPMRFQRRGGRKRIVASDGSEVVPTSKPQPDGTLIKALARARRWQRMLEDGVYASVSDIGDAENISKSYVSRILRLALLAPDIVEAIVTGRAGESLMLEKLEQRSRRAGWSSANAHSAHAPPKKRAALASGLRASPESRRRQARSSEAGRLKRSSSISCSPLSPRRASVWRARSARCRPTRGLSSCRPWAFWPRGCSSFDLSPSPFSHSVHSRAGGDNRLTSSVPTI